MLRIPINHFEGNYTCDAETLAVLRGEDRVVVRYVDNPNGSVDDIAGICNEGRNVVGLMPHPERACHPLLGSNDGAVLLRSAPRGRGGADRAGSARAADPGPLQHGRLHAELAPGGVGDALARAVGGGALDELRLEPGEVDLGAGVLELGCEVEPLLDQLEPLQGVGGRQLGLDPLEALLDGVCGPLAPPLRAWASSASR